MPPGYRLAIDGAMLWLFSPDGGRAGSSSYWLTSDTLSEEEALVGGTQSLHQIQQEIAEETAEPWPVHSGPGYRCFPEPDGEIVDDSLRLWFGNWTEPGLALEPIDLAGVVIRD